jgi:hypothetical protein
MSTDFFDRDALKARWRRNEAELNRLRSMSPLERESFGARIEELEAEQLDLLLRAVAPSRELSGDESRQLREALKRVIPAVRDVQRKQAAAIEEAVRDGTLEELFERWQVKCIKCGGPVVMHVTEPNPDTGEVKTFICARSTHASFATICRPQRHSHELPCRPPTFAARMTA